MCSQNRLYKLAELSMLYRMDTTEVFKIAHSLSSVRSPIMLCLAAATGQVSRQWLHHQQAVDQQFRLLLAMCTSRHSWASALSGLACVELRWTWYRHMWACL